MFHNDDTLNLLEKFRKNKFNEKECGQFKTKSKENKNSNFIWITIVVLVGYFIITTVIPKGEKQNEVKQEIVHKTQKVIQTTNKIIERNIEITPSKPIIEIPQNVIKVEPKKQIDTIIIMPQQSKPKQEPIKKIEEEEIRPSSSTTNIGYYR